MKTGKGDHGLTTIFRAIEGVIAPVTRVGDVMTADPTPCRSGDSLDHAAHVMWERACGCVPVVDDEMRPIAMLTDRDVCMAAYTQGRPLAELRVGSAMSSNLLTADAREPLADAERRLCCYGLRRLPVVDAAGVLVGLLSLSDVARAAQFETSPGRDPLSESAVAHSFAAAAHAHR